MRRDIGFTHGLDVYPAGESEIVVDLEAPICLCGLFTPLLAGRAGAAIVNVPSGPGFVPAARIPVCSASKAGLHACMMALRWQLRALRVKVYEVWCPRPWTRR